MYPRYPEILKTRVMVDMVDTGYGAENLIYYTVFTTFHLSY